MFRLARFAIRAVIAGNSSAFLRDAFHVSPFCGKIRASKKDFKTETRQ